MIDDIDFKAGAQYLSPAFTNYDGAESGSITLTSVSPYWEGTFSFTTFENVKVTDGKFKVKAP